MCSQEKITRSTVLNARRAKEFVVPSTLTRCIGYFALYGANVPGTFFNTTHQVKAIAIGVSVVNPLGELVDCCSPLHSTRVLPLNSRILFEIAIPQYPLL